MGALTRILFVHQTGGWGGAGIMLANIIGALDRTCFVPVVVCPPGDAVEQLTRAGAEVHVAPQPIHQFTHISGYQYPCCHPAFLRGAVGQWRAQSFWRDYFRESGAEIIHLNAVTLAPLAPAARAAGAKVLCCVQETAVHGLLGLRTRWLRHLLSTQMDAVVFISEFDRMAAHCAAPLVEVIPNWVNLEQFAADFPQAQARRQFDLPEDARVVLMMGGIDPLKGTLPLLQAFARLAEMPNLHLLIAGNCAPPPALSGIRRWRQAVREWPHGNYWQRCMDVIAERQLDGRVHLVGMQHAVSPLYAAADVVAFPAIHPHQARPVLEAGALKKPVVVTDFPQLHEFVQDGVNGLRVRPGDIGALAQAIERLVQDAPYAARLGEANYRMTLAKHRQTVNALRFNALYQQLRERIAAC